MHQFNRVGLVATGCLIVWLTMVSPMSAISNTHLVHPGDSIQAAVDAASPGDTVMVRAGTYRESVRIQTDGLTLRAQGSVTLEPSTYGAGECYLPGHVAGFCVVPADFDPTSGSYTRRVSDGQFHFSMRIEPDVSPARSGELYNPPKRPPIRYVSKRTEWYRAYHFNAYERDESGWWVASVRGLRGCHTQGRTVHEARRRIVEAMELFVSDARTR